ncbi:MAG TPA: SRPBCC domain-containing protein [Thermoanaerobaculia bacterium]|nr:SRPBCC domain-containing protein [Thermoanaerobaculia bacterium]
MSETERAVFKVLIHGTLEQVWEELTRTEGVQRAMFNSRMHVDRLAPGGQIRMRTPSGKFTAVAGRIVEVTKPRRFSHTFRFTSYDDPPCKVTYELEEVEGGVELRLVIDDLPKGTKTAKSMLQGGPFITKTLKAIVERGAPALGTRLLLGLMGLAEPFTPKRARSSEWPLEREVG